MSLAAAATSSGSGSAPEGTAVGEHYIDREVDEHRSPVWCQRRHDRIVDDRRDVFDGGDRAGELRDGRQQGHVVELLQRAGAPPSLWGATTQHNDCRAVEVRLCDGRHAVGDAGTGREDGEPGPACETGIALGGEGGGLLVPHVDDPSGRIALDRRVEEREDVPTRQREQRVDAEGANGGQRQLAPVVADRGPGIVCHVTPESARTGAPIAIARRRVA
jgi:hypothetical protein